jgi:alanine dehydrogenase
MIIGVPRELKVAENRVALTPAGARALVDEGHRVIVETRAGEGSGFPDEDYTQVRAEIRPAPEEVWGEAEMIVKVKEPVEPEFDWMRPGQIIFSYLHLAADRRLTERLLEAWIVGIAYETVQSDSGALPLLAPMSAVAGRLSIQAGAFSLEAENKGRGVLLSGVPGVAPAKVVIIGAGVAGMNSCLAAVGSGARVSVMDVDFDRLTYLSEILAGRVNTLFSNQHAIDQQVSGADLVVGAVLIPGARTPKLISRDLLKTMKPGAVIVDISIDQGGCAETSRPTTHNEPTYVEEGVVHYCVNNMPGAVPRTSTLAMTNSTLPYILKLAAQGCHQALADDPVLARGLNLFEGGVVSRPVAESLGFPCVTPRFIPAGAR